MSDKDDKGSAPPEGESQDKGEKKGSKTIPIEAFNAALNDLKGRLARKEQELEEAKRQAAVAAAPKPLTKAQLNEAVEGGRITQEAADALWEQQVVETATRRASEAATKAVSAREVEAAVNRSLADFQTLVPAAWEDGSQERARVAREYATLVALGNPPNKATEVAALRACFGDPDAIRRSRTFGTSGTADTFHETGGGGEAGGGGGDKDGAPRGLRPEQKTRYERLIQQGVYSGWDAVKAELKFAKQRRA